MKTTMEQSNIIPVGSGPTILRSDRSIGNILTHAGRLAPESIEKILQLQREGGLRFGDAARQLGLLNATDIEFALARQFDCPYLLRGESSVSEQVVAAYEPFGAPAEALSILRNQLMLRWLDSATDDNTLAIVSAGRGEGRSFIASNLAVAFAQLSRRTLLIDADMRNPVQHDLFGIDNRGGLSAMLSGRGAVDSVIHRIPGLPGLSVLPAGAQPPNPLELLSRPLFPQILGELASEFGVIILDSPAASDYPDSQSIAARARAVLIVTRTDATRMSQLRSAAEALSRANTHVVGTVLNDF